MERAAAELRLWRLVLELEGNPDKAAAHFLDQCGGGYGKLEEEGGFGVEAVVLDTEPDMASATVAKDGADDHSFGGARRDQQGNRSWGRRLRGGVVFTCSSLVLLGMEWEVIKVVAEGCADALLGGDGVEVGGRVNW